MGLSQMPPNGTSKKNWKDLDQVLLANFKAKTFKENRSATINADEFEMSIDEIVKEAESNGYKVQVLPNNMIRFTD
ncbi:hypothetical protein BKP56_09095 [Marinilactibacillus sp. 15R]|uniref:hypothetical protein n=1 Tax=Marinilactibacillus sp. 15R TaxID=1911586 RepID=UPI00090C890D|nr:hypothetical protein [Marinilactibacillus sp. 15R]API89399.1 hypothetical protein BKP56_09095 [Marinilactibacillus sp. 15R]